MKRSILKTTFGEVQNYGLVLTKFEKLMRNVTQKSALLEISESWNKLKLHKLNCDWNEKIIKTDSHFLRTLESTGEDNDSDSSNLPFM